MQDSAQKTLLQQRLEEMGECGSIHFPALDAGVLNRFAQLPAEALVDARGDSRWDDLPEGYVCAQTADYVESVLGASDGAAGDGGEDDVTVERDHAEELLFDMARTLDEMGFECQASLAPLRLSPVRSQPCVTSLGPATLPIRRVAIATAEEYFDLCERLIEAAGGPATAFEELAGTRAGLQGSWLEGRIFKTLDFKRAQFARRNTEQARAEFIGFVRALVTAPLAALWRSGALTPVAGGPKLTPTTELARRLAALR